MLQIFGVVLISVFSVVNGFTEIKKTPKCEKHIEWPQQHQTDTETDFNLGQLFKANFKKFTLISQPEPPPPPPPSLSKQKAPWLLSTEI